MDPHREGRTAYHSSIHWKWATSLPFTLLDHGWTSEMGSSYERRADGCRTKLGPPAAGGILPRPRAQFELVGAILEDDLALDQVGVGHTRLTPEVFAFDGNRHLPDLYRNSWHVQSNRLREHATAGRLSWRRKSVL